MWLAVMTGQPCDFGDGDPPELSWLDDSGQSGLYAGTCWFNCSYMPERADRRR